MIGKEACICSQPEGATEVVPAPGISYLVTCPSRDSSPMLGGAKVPPHLDWEPVGPCTRRPAIPQAQSLQPCPHATSRKLWDHPRETEPLRGTYRPLDHLTEKSEAEPHILGCFSCAPWWRVCFSVALSVVSSGPVSRDGLLCSDVGDVCPARRRKQ